MIALVARARGTFDAVQRTITFAAPATAHGDVMIALVSHNAADPRGAVPATWTVVTAGAGADALDIYTRAVGANEPAAFTFTFPAATSEWLGELLVFRGAAPGAIVETTGAATFTAATSLRTAAIASQQAVNLILATWTCAGAPALTLPAGFTSVDNFSSSIVSARSMLLGIRLAGATGTLALPDASAATSTTGRSFTFALRDRPPVQPAPLVDIVPGNLGLIGKDTRRAR